MPDKQNKNEKKNNGDSNKYFKLFYLTAVFFHLIFPTAAFAEEYVRVAGTGSGISFLKIIGQNFEKANPGIKIMFIPSLGSTGGIKAVADKAVDIAISSRDLNDRGKKQELSMIEYAKSPLIFIVNANVPVSDITTDDMIQIYKGSRQNWSDGQRIRLSLRQRNETDTQIIKKISSEVNDALESAFSRRGLLTALTDQENAALIEKTSGAFGSATLAQVIAEKRRVKVLTYNGVVPSIKNLVSGSYPLVRHYYIVHRRDLTVPARNFLLFLMSAQSRKVLESNGNLSCIQ